ncbi:MAG TPA: hypothetical protein VGC14_00220 [Rhizobium sp.]
MRNIDFSSWQSIVLTVFGLIFVTLISIGVRLVMMMTVQQRRERMNRQINERLKTLIAAYKTLGGSFTGTLTVDPTHLRDLRRGSATDDLSAEATIETQNVGSARRRQIRDAVEAALSDVILLGTEQHVRLATAAIHELVLGHPVRTQELVVSLRAFIREALDLDPFPGDIVLPEQGPTRPFSSGARGKGERETGGTKGAGGGSGGGLNGMGGGGAINPAIMHRDEQHDPDGQ